MEFTQPRRILQNTRQRKTRRHYQPPPIPKYTRDSDADSEGESLALHKPLQQPIALHAFTNSRFSSKQDIALATVLRHWREMAQAAVERREQLIKMWRDAFKFRRSALVSHSLSLWKSRLQARLTSNENQYEKVQMQLATMHYRQSILKRLWDKVVRMRGLAQREAFLKEHHKAQVVEKFLDLWKRKLVRDRISALEQASRMAASRQRQQLLMRALAVWREQAYFSRCEQIVQCKGLRNLAVHAIRVWQLQLAEKRFVARHASSLNQIREQQSEIKQQQLEHNYSDVVSTQLRAIIGQWRNTTETLYEQQAKADEFRAQMLVQDVLDNLFEAALNYRLQKAQADRFLKFTSLNATFSKWRYQMRAHRDDIQQSRALREWARRRAQQRRRVLLTAWHKMAVSRGRINSLKVTSWLEDAETQGPLTVDAQTMTSFLVDERPLKCDRGISIQSDELVHGTNEISVQPQPATTTANDLMPLPQPQEDANSLPQHYGTVDSLTQPQEAVDSCAELDQLLMFWRRHQRARLMSKVIVQLSMASAKLKSKREQQLQALQAADTQKLRNMIRSWRQVVKTHEQQATKADLFHHRWMHATDRSVCVSMIQHWRQRLKTMRQLEMAVAKRQWVSATGQFFRKLTALVSRNREMARDASSWGREVLLRRVWDNLYMAASAKVAERSRRSTVLEPPHQVQEVAQGGMVLDDVAKEELSLVFNGWRDVAQEMRVLEMEALSRLPVTLQPCAYSEPNGQFSWDTVYLCQLLRGALKKWHRQMLSQRDEDKYVKRDEGARMRKLREIETVVVRKRQSRVLHRWMVSVRGKLLESRQLNRTLEQAVRAVSERARLVRLAQVTAEKHLLQPTVQHWWRRYYIHCSQMGNADTQAQGTLLRLCLLNWLSQLRQHKTHDGGRHLYTKALAFRWEKQARRSLLTWMRASTDERICVRMAQRSDGAERELKLIKAADLWRQKKMKQKSLRKIARVARLQKLHREISMRFATAWANANIQRHALHTWRTRVSPSSSMFFSIAGC
ncbi:hypothetical protein IWW36_001113 [Coemansia brasiliensis]|uniref:Sfi1 spindle body domain-containing protein n=1 Tax=Coemansia brasiliensis TaxID=2650707 RepID=A0A9W8I9P1_9FUNG|nr:hypothetical protein IWW36_001113 [Coemansia brasiliensis]